MHNQIIILTNGGDPSVSPVIEHLAAMGQTYHRFDTESFPKESRIAIHLRASALTGFLAEGNHGSQNRDVRWENVKSVWYRRPVMGRVSEHLGLGPAQFAREEAAAALWSLYTSLDAFWLNPPLIGSRLLEHNKLYQLKVAAILGLRVPRSLITNDPDELLTFCESNGGVLAVKVLKGNFFRREGNNVPLFVFTQRIELAQFLQCKDAIRMAPVLAQEYVPKKIELRVTVVGQKVFSCAIHSQNSPRTQHDWRRYDFANVKHEPYELPSEVIAKLQQLMKFWRLGFGAIDMIVTPDGEYIFLEINPTGQWDWIEKLTGMPISRAIAELLAYPPERSSPTKAPLA
ncbi:MAG: MvdC/MvdD family ATP grasp protein [Limisphaerales bacterium]